MSDRCTWTRGVLTTLLSVILISGAGCAYKTPLNATPNIYQGGLGKQVFDQVPEALRTGEIGVIYATDRKQEGTTEAGPKYVLGRSTRIAFGEATVALEPATSWDELVTASTEAKRAHDYTLRTTKIREAGQIQSIAELFDVKNRQIELPPESQAIAAGERKAFQKLLEEKLALSPHKEVFVLVHGVNNSFDDAVHRAAQIWHFAGREGVAVAYSWPAGGSGLRGYFQDRESGEYTVLHLKTILMAIAECPSVEKVHIVAHSRGTDVTATALRELSLGYLARGEDPAKKLKLQTLVLASPDLDAAVFRERFLFETLGRAQEHLVIYFSPEDALIKISKWLFRSTNRVGGMSPNDFTLKARVQIVSLGMDFVYCDVSGFSTSHDYEFAHPAVVSDLIKVLRDNAAPGAENGRPLKSPAEGLWEIDNNYGLPGKSPK